MRDEGYIEITHKSQTRSRILMTSSNSNSLSRAWLRANCCHCGDTRQDTANNNFKDVETPLREETETLLHRIAFTVWHTALHIESEVRANRTCLLARARATRAPNRKSLCMYFFFFFMYVYIYIYMKFPADFLSILLFLGFVYYARAHVSVLES